MSMKIQFGGVGGDSSSHGGSSYNETISSMLSITDDQATKTVAAAAAATAAADDVPELITDHAISLDTKIFLWAGIHGVLLLAIFSGNVLTILAIRCSRKLRSIKSNVFIRSLAISDMFVAFTLPYHLAFYLGSGLGQSKMWCLLRFVLIINACCASIWNLISIAVDRYIAIVYPLHYNRYMTKRVAYCIIGMGWTMSISISIVPTFWNNWDHANQCEFDEVLPPWYLAGILTPIFSTIWICMLLLYTRIWREAKRHLKQLRTSTCGLNEGSSDWKSVQVVLLIMGCFSICWLPFFIVACMQIFKLLGNNSPTIYRVAFSMAMANSSMNPIIYAWKNANFRRAFGCLLRCRYPDLNEMSPMAARSKSKSQDCPTVNTNRIASLQKRCGSTGSGGSASINLKKFPLDGKVSSSTTVSPPLSPPARKLDHIISSKKTIDRCDSNDRDQCQGDDMSFVASEKNVAETKTITAGSVIVNKLANYSENSNL